MSEICICRGNLKREKRFSINSSPKNNAMRTNYIKAIKAKIQKNTKYKLCGERDEIVIIISWLIKRRVFVNLFQPIT